MKQTKERKKMNLAIIPARGGSKRIPTKILSYLQENQLLHILLRLLKRQVFLIELLFLLILKLLLMLPYNGGQKFHFCDLVGLLMIILVLIM